MKLLFNLLILLFVAGIGAQRARTSSSDSSSEAPTRRSRGRVKFTVPTDISEKDLLDAAAPIERQHEAAKTVDRKVPRAPNKPYEVKEVLDDIPNLNVRKIHKPRVITETRFEAANAPKKPLYLPLPLPEDEILPEDLLANFAPQATKASVEKTSGTTAKGTSAAAESVSQSTVIQNSASTEEILPITTNLGQSSELTTVSEQSSSTENEIKKIDATTPVIKKKSEPVQIVTPVSDIRKSTRIAARSRIHTTEGTPKTRTRTRPARRQDSDGVETSSVSNGNTRVRTRLRQDAKSDDGPISNKPPRLRPIRKRLDVAEITAVGGKGRVPSLFSAEDTLEGPLKSRTGRKVNYPSASENESVQTNDRRSYRRRTALVKDKTTNSIESTTQDIDNQSSSENSRSFRRSGSRNVNRNTRGRTTESQKEGELSTSAPNLNRRTSIGRGRKVNTKVEKRVVEAVDSAKNDKQVESTNKNEVIKSKPIRSRGHSTEKIETKEESVELVRSRIKSKPIENEIVSTTTASSPTTRIRRVEHQSRIKPEVQLESKLEERIVSTTQSTVPTENRRNIVRTRVDARRNKPLDEVTPTAEATFSRNDNRRRSFSRKANTIEPPIKETSTEARDGFRSRPRTRYIPPIIDEQKLEVLPLFESEVKTVMPIRKRPNPSRENLNLASSLEHQIKIGSNNEIQADSPKVRIETKTERSEKIAVRTSKPIIKESVETNISEVVSKRKIGRQVVRKVKVNKSNNISNDNEKSNETNDNGRKAVKVATTVRGHKRAEFKDKNKNLSTLSSSEEEIGDSDNYPEPFKALIQAQLVKHSASKGSRPHKTPNEDGTAKSTERIVTSSRIIPIASATTAARTTASTTTPVTASSRVNDDDNELVPLSSTTNPRPTRRRFSLSTKYPESEESSSRYSKHTSYPGRKVTRSTVSPSHVSVVTEVSAKVRKQSRYHARFSAAKKNEKPTEKNAGKSTEKDIEIVTSTPKSRSYSPKPPRGLYSIRNGSKKRTGKLESPPPTQQIATGAKKNSRYSARYRSDIFSRAGSTRPTSAPAYTPTVPSVTTPVKSGVEDNISGMEVISIDDPVNTIPSDSLINGELLSPPNPYKNPSPKLVPASLVTKDGGSTTASLPKSTEKPISIIERIIYSITAISTASPDLAIDLINDGPTKASAILKIPSKSTKEDVTIDALAQQRQPTVTINEIKPLTTDKPTTIIERILSSISAIQASSTTERTDTQVGNSLNAISTTFKPLSGQRGSTTVSTTVSTTLSPSSTPQDALGVIEQISSEQSLQQHTISKLLALLKSITPDTPSTENVVVVTPKLTSFTSATSESAAINRDVEIFNISSNFVSEVSERISESQFSTPNTSQSSNDIASRFGSTAASPASNANNDISSSTVANVATELSTSPIFDVGTSTTSSSATELNNVVDTTTPDLLQNTIAQNTAATESATNTPSSSEGYPTIKVNSRLPDTISISDFLATLDTLNSIEPTTPSSSVTTTSSNTLTTGTQTNESIIESTTPSFTNESTTSINTATSAAAESPEFIAVNNIASTTIESANLVTVTDIPSTTVKPMLQELSVPNNGTISITTESPEISSSVTNSDGSATTLAPNQFANLETLNRAKSINNEATTVNNVGIVTTGVPPGISPSGIQESTTKLNEMLITTKSAPISNENATPQPNDNNSMPIEAQEPAVTTEIPSTISSLAQSDVLTTSTDSSNTIPDPTVPSTSAILAMLSRLLEITGRTQALTTLTLEQTTVTPAVSVTPLLSSTGDGGTTFVPLSTIGNFEVSPGSVSIFSANDLSSMFNPTDDGTTVTILSRSFLTTSSPTTESSVTESTPELVPSTVTNAITSPSSDNSAPAMATTVVSADSSAALMSTTAPPSDKTTTLISTTTSSADKSAALISTTTSASDNSTVPAISTDEIAATTLTSDISANIINTTNSPSADIVATTTMSTIDNSAGDIDSTTQVAMTETSTESMLPVTDGANIDVTTLNIIESSSNNSNAQSMGVSNDTSANVTNTAMQETPSNATESSSTAMSVRGGRVLAIEPDPVQNELQVSSEAPDKDYFVFGILPNNTILRKRPSKYPNKNTPFIIVGVYPNNTIIQKFPNGTIIPEEPVIQVSGFDTRENPPTLPEITSNQVTQDSSPPDDNTNRQTAVSRNVMASNDASRLVTTTPPAITTSSPPTATMPTLADASGGTPANSSQNGKPKVGNNSRDIEEVNIEENTISNNGNNKPEKIVEQTTPAQTPTAPIQSTTQVPTTVVPITQEVTTTKPTTTSGRIAPIMAITTTSVPITTSAPETTPLAAIKIDDLQDEEGTTFAVIDMTTIVPNVENRFGSSEASTTTGAIIPTRLIVPVTTTPRYTNTVTSVAPFSETIQLTIRPTTPYLIQRIIGNVVGIPVRIGGEPTTNIPISSITTQAPTTEVVTTPFTIRSRARVPTTTQAPTTITASVTTPAAITTQAPTTQPPTTTFRSRGRSRFSLTTTEDSFVRTVTVTPSTISTPSPITTDFPIRTTFTPRRYTQTPTTINVPSRIVSFTPTTGFASIPTATEQNFLSTTGFEAQNAAVDISTVFPVYTSTFEATTETPASPDTTTNTPPTFASTQRPRQRTTTPFTTLSPNLERLAELRVRDNFGELSTTTDFFNPTTVPVPIASVTVPTTLQTTLKTINSKVKQLTEQQKKDLEELAKLEREQETILQQLAFLTRLNLGGSPKPTRSPSNLAGRVLDFAAERNKPTSTENPSSFNLLESLTRQNSKPSESKTPSIEDILKQLNVNPNSVTASSLSSTYGKSTDAILAALLKEQGIQPSTPKSLGDQLKTTTPVPYTTTTRRVTTTRRRVVTTTTPRPGPIMQGLNWLLNALAPTPTTKRPPTKKNVRATTTPRLNTIPAEVELISSQPTELTPVVVTAPPRARGTSPSGRQAGRPRKPLHSLSEEELRNLINQLETAQKDPSKARNINLDSLDYTASTAKSTTLLANNAVQITNSGKVGTSSKLIVAEDFSATEPDIVPLVYKRGRPTTPIPSGVSNSIVDDVREELTTTRSRRTTVPPLQLNPIPGIDAEGEPQVRGQLINAAVNVTRAISQFLGSAIQDAAYQLTHLFSNGSDNLRNAIIANVTLPTISTASKSASS